MYIYIYYDDDDDDDDKDEDAGTVSQGQDNVGRKATVKGYGVTEQGGLGDLLETNVTVISNELCKEYIAHNSSLNRQIKRQVDKALDNGLNYGFLCAQGEVRKDGTITGSCKVRLINFY